MSLLVHVSGSIQPLSTPLCKCHKNALRFCCFQLWLTNIGYRGVRPCPVLTRRIQRGLSNVGGARHALAHVHQCPCCSGGGGYRVVYAVQQRHVAGCCVLGAGRGLLLVLLGAGRWGAVRLRLVQGQLCTEVT